MTLRLIESHSRSVMDAFHESDSIHSLSACQPVRSQTWVCAGCCPFHIWSTFSNESTRLCSGRVGSECVSRSQNWSFLSEDGAWITITNHSWTQIRDGAD
jgi:hypothetical protein